MKITQGFGYIDDDDSQLVLDLLQEKLLMLSKASEEIRVLAPEQVEREGIARFCIWISLRWALGVHSSIVKSCMC